MKLQLTKSLPKQTPINGKAIVCVTANQYNQNT